MDSFEGRGMKLAGEGRVEEGGASLNKNLSLHHCKHSCVTNFDMESST